MARERAAAVETAACAAKEYAAAEERAAAAARKREAMEEAVAKNMDERAADGNVMAVVDEEARAARQLSLNSGITAAAPKLESPATGVSADIGSVGTAGATLCWIDAAATSIAAVAPASAGSSNTMLPSAGGGTAGGLAKLADSQKKKLLVAFDLIDKNGDRLLSRAEVRQPLFTEIGNSNFGC